MLCIALCGAKNSMALIIDELKSGFKGDLAFDEDTLKQYSWDASIFEIKPSLVASPRDAEDVQHLVRFVNKHPSFSLTARSAGTDMTGGPLNSSIIVAFTPHMCALRKLDATHAVVEPGLYYRDLERAMDALGVMYPSYPASKSLCALGGIIVNNAGGEKSLVYGQTVNHVNRLSVVLADGNVYEFRPLSKAQLRTKMRPYTFEGRLYRKIYTLCEKNYDLIQSAKPASSKNSSGYYLWDVWDKKTFDLAKLFVGSQGTLGILVEADIKLVPKKKHSRLVVVSLDKLEQIGSLLETVRAYHPESLESFDIHTLRLGLKFMPEVAKKVNQSLFSFLWGFRREVWQAVFHGLALFTVLVELTGDDESLLSAQARSLSVDLRKKHLRHLVMPTEVAGTKYWVMRRESFNLLRQKVKEKSATPFIDDFSVKPKYLAEFLPKLYALLEEHDIQPTLAGHVGDGNFHIIPLMNLNDSAERAKIPIVLEKFVQLVRSYGGTITAEHNDGLIRTPFLEQQFGPAMVRLFEEVKDIFDPHDIFNPGKKVRGDLAFALSHIKPT